MKFIQRSWRIRFSLAMLLGVMIPCAILAALFAREWQWHRFRARELAKLNSSLDALQNGPDYQPDDGGAAPPTGFMPWLLGEHYVPPVTKIKIMPIDNPYAYAMTVADGLVLKKGDEHRLNFHALPELEELTLLNSRNQFQTESVQALTNLRRFEYGAFYSYGQPIRVDPLLEKYIQALPRMPQLTAFSVKNSPCYLDGKALTVLLEKAPQLAELDVSLFKLGPEVIQALQVPRPLQESQLRLGNQT